MRCDKCGIIPIVDIRTVADYATCINAWEKMINAGVVSTIYQTCPLDEVIVDGKFKQQKLFHQFKCNTCGTVYGMYVDARFGGEIKINDKEFDPADYPDKKDD